MRVSPRLPKPDRQPIVTVVHESHVCGRTQATPDDICLSGFSVNPSDKPKAGNTLVAWGWKGAALDAVEELLSAVCCSDTFLPVEPRTRCERWFAPKNTYFPLSEGSTRRGNRKEPSTCFRYDLNRTHWGQHARTCAILYCCQLLRAVRYINSSMIRVVLSTDRWSLKVPRALLHMFHAKLHCTRIVECLRFERTNTASWTHTREFNW